jgi:hypothetical protein
MKQNLKYLLLFALMLSLVGLVACSDDDDDGDNNGGTNPPVPDAWVGTWLSAEEDVAPILVAVFNYDSVRVTMNDDNTISLETHIDGGAWSTLPGVYTVTESAGSDIDAIAINYTAFEQEGIMQVWAASPDSMWLEVVQTVPDISATPLTPADGFGADGTLGTTNIQKYRKID